MGLLKSHRINRNHFAEGDAPTKSEWRDLVLSNPRLGKVINGTVYIDQDYFIASNELEASALSIQAVDILRNAC